MVDHYESSDLDHGFSWYVIHVASGSESKVSDEVKSRLERVGRLDALKNVSVPRQKVVMVSRGERVEVNEVLFPGYVFVEIAMDTDVASAIQSIPRVMRILGADDHSDHIKALSDEAAKAVNSYMHGAGESVARVHTLHSYQEGDVVRIKEGPFSEMEGDVEYVDRQKEKLKVSVPLLGRHMPVDLHFSQVEKVVS